MKHAIVCLVVTMFSAWSCDSQVHSGGKTIFVASYTYIVREYHE